MAISIFSALPEQDGLYDPSFEHDACGVAMVATLNKSATHEIVEQGLEALRNLDHRGASGAEVNSGDGAGIMIGIPDEFFRSALGFKLPDVGSYAAGIAFIPKQFKELGRLESLAKEEGLVLLGWREVPIDPSSLGETAVSVMPNFQQIFLAGSNGESGIELDRKAFCFRKRAEHQLQIYFCSLSSQTIVYKGMLTTHQLSEFFPDLRDARLA